MRDQVSNSPELDAAEMIETQRKEKELGAEYLCRRHSSMTLLVCSFPRNTGRGPEWGER